MPAKPSPKPEPHPPAYDTAAHRCHDFFYLAERWRALAPREGLALREITQPGGPPLLLAERPAAPGAPSVYLSAGIHGDEPAGTEGLIWWAGRRLSAWPGAGLVILPCLNPAGLLANQRADARGRDLNRGWQRPSHPLSRLLRAVLKDRRFDLALTLHEDYDATGVYLYEPAARRPYWGGRLLSALPMPRDPRRLIDGSRARNGLIRRVITPSTLPEWPEAVWLHLRYAARTFTLETPSEFGLDARVLCQAAFIEAAFGLLFGETARRPLRAGKPARPVPK